MLEIQVNNGDPAVLDTTNATPLEMEVLNRRAERNALLQESDKFIVADYPTSKKAEWETYRESLRNMDFSDPDNLTWPTKPE